MRTSLKLASIGAVLLVAGCVSMPSGPSVMTLPGSGKSFDQFRTDDLSCRQYANHQVGGATPNDAAANSAISSAVIGTAIGALAGAALGGRNDAAAGAGIGLMTGGLVGASTGNASGYELQRRYDNGYLQCMYSLGHKIPTYGNYQNTSRPVTRYTQSPPVPPSANTPPPPPAGAPPPPPPGVN